MSAMSGLPDPEIDREFYDGVPARRLVAWFVDVLLILAMGVPLALAFGLLTLGFGFVLFPLLIAGVGFFYRTATIASGSATWGMRFVGIELRRSDGSRFDVLTALLHTALYTAAFSVIVLQMISCLSIVGTRYGQGLPDLVLRTTAINSPAD
jgi:uncharacterized RDD family membrane protein YckC